MNHYIQPVMDIQTVQHLSAFTVEDRTMFTAQMRATLNTLQTKLGPERLLPTITSIPQPVPEDQIVIWIVSAEEDDHITAVVNQLSSKERQHLVLFDYGGEHPLALLEQTRVLALVTSEAVSSWRNNRDKRFHKMGRGYGIYGMKSLFDPSVFDSNHQNIFDSENYMILYDYALHDVDMILLLYIDHFLKRPDGTGLLNGG